MIDWIKKNNGFVTFVGLLILLIVLIFLVQRGCEHNPSPTPTPTPTPPPIVIVDNAKQQIILDCLRLMSNSPEKDRLQVWNQGTSRIRLNEEWIQPLKYWDDLFITACTLENIENARDYFSTPQELTPNVTP